MKTTSIGIGLVLFGGGIFAFTFIRLVQGDPLDPQAKVPGTVSTDIGEPGRYYLWDNHWTVFDGEHLKYADDCPADAQVSVRDSGGAEIEFVADASQSWGIGNNARTSIGYVDVPSPVNLEWKIDAVGRDRIVSVSNRTMKQELWVRLGGLAVGLAVGLAGVVVFLIGLLTGRSDSNVRPNLPGTNADPTAIN